jgi:hypothetical protein
MRPTLAFESSPSGALFLQGAGGSAHEKRAETRELKLWQGCGKKPDFTDKADIIDNFLLNGISNLCVSNVAGLHPAYKLIRHLFQHDRNSAAPHICLP